MGLPLLAAALASLACTQPVAGHRIMPGDGLAPLPPGWSAQQPEPRPHGSSARWGVPAFEPPAASHCHGVPPVREVPGALPRRQGPDAWESADAAAPVARAAAESLAGVAKARDGHGEPPLAWAPPQPQAVGRADDVKAGMVDDNADFGAYLSFRARSGQVPGRDRDVSERYRIDLRDAAGRPVVDAEVALSWPGARASRRVARSDAFGRVWLHPRALVAPDELARLGPLEVQARSVDGEVVRAALQRGQKAAVELRFAAAAPAAARVPLDVVFLVDATGSMGDEIAKLRDSMATIAERVAALPARPDLCWGLVAYRDRGDAFLTRTHDLTDDLGAFRGALARLQASGGGDYPEALDEALHEAVHGIRWRGPGATRLVVLLGDAPPHLDRAGPAYDEDSAAALARGIKIHAVGASGLDRVGEAVFRQIAQNTGGRFIFLTYRDPRHPGRGAGAQTLHDVRDYSVDTLDELVVRLVRDELAARAPG